MNLIRNIVRHIHITACLCVILRLVQRWRWDGTHYERTSNAWLANVDARRDEVLAAHKRQLERFDQADTNKDGVLSREELRASRDAMREEHRKRAAERRGAGQQQPAPASGAPQPAPQTKG